MAASVNRVILIGNLGADPEIRSTQNGKRIANLRLATSETWKDASGARQERTSWHQIAIFSEGLVGVVEKYLRKGSKIYVQGSLQTRKWQDKQGQDRYTTEVVLQGYNCELVMLDGASGGGTRQPVSAGAVDDNYYPQPDDEQSWQSAPVGKAGGGYGAAKSGGGAWKEKKMDEDVPF